MATEKRLIDANVFKEFLENVRQDYIEKNTYSSDFAASVIETVQDNYLALAPTVDAVEVVHGHWVSDEGDVLFHCSECDTQISTSWDYDDLLWNYCPNCGAKMDGDGNGT